MRVNELLGDFKIWTSNEESNLLEKLTAPIQLSSLTERDQVIAQSLIRKSLITKIGQHNPIITKNETDKLPNN